MRIGKCPTGPVLRPRGWNCGSAVAILRSTIQTPSPQPGGGLVAGRPRLTRAGPGWPPCVAGAPRGPVLGEIAAAGGVAPGQVPVRAALYRALLQHAPEARGGRALERPNPPMMNAH